MVWCGSVFYTTKTQWYYVRWLIDWSWYARVPYMDVEIDILKRDMTRPRLDNQKSLRASQLSASSKKEGRSCHKSARNFLRAAPSDLLHFLHSRWLISYENEQRFSISVPLVSSSIFKCMLVMASARYEVHESTVLHVLSGIGEDESKQAHSWKVFWIRRRILSRPDKHCLNKSNGVSESLLVKADRISLYK